VKIDEEDIEKGLRAYSNDPPWFVAGASRGVVRQRITVSAEASLLAHSRQGDGQWHAPSIERAAMTAAPGVTRPREPNVRTALYHFCVRLKYRKSGGA
jgi:hypothetical protein